MAAMLVEARTDLAHIHAEGLLLGQRRAHAVQRLETMVRAVVVIESSGLDQELIELVQSADVDDDREGE